MFGKIGVRRQQESGSFSGKLAKIEEQMALVVVAGFNGHIGPIGSSAVQLREHSLETGDAAQNFGRNPYMLTKESLELAFTDAAVIRKLRHRKIALGVSDRTNNVAYRSGRICIAE